jgi:tetratricopeptide (TPR) repeat protein
MPKNRPPEEPTEPDILGHLTEKVWPFLVRNALHFAVALCLVMVAILGYKTLALRRQARTLSQWAEVGAAPEMAAYFYGAEAASKLRQEAVKGYERILDESSRTTATPWVMLKLGNLRAMGGDWQGAADAYRRLLKEYPGSRASGPARCGLAAALEQLGQYGDAAALYEQVARSGQPMFFLDAGRCRELASDAQAAQAAYATALKEPTFAQDLRSIAQHRLAAVERGELLTPPPAVKPLPQEPEPGTEPLLVPEETETVPAETPPATAGPDAGRPNAGETAIPLTGGPGAQ